MPYGVSPTPDDLLQAWSGSNESAEKALRLPGPNIFIPDDFSLVCDREAEAMGGIGSEGDAGVEVKDGSSAGQDAAKAREGRSLAAEDRRGESEREREERGREGGGSICHASVSEEVFCLWYMYAQIGLIR